MFKRYVLELNEFDISWNRNKLFIIIIMSTVITIYYCVFCIILYRLMLIHFFIFRTGRFWPIDEMFAIQLIEIVIRHNNEGKERESFFYKV